MPIEQSLTPKGAIAPAREPGAGRPAITVTGTDYGSDLVGAGQDPDGQSGGPVRIPIRIRHEDDEPDGIGDLSGGAALPAEDDVIVDGRIITAENWDSADQRADSAGDLSGGATLPAEDDVIVDGRIITAENWDSADQRADSAGDLSGGAALPAEDDVIVDGRIITAENWDSVDQRPDGAGDLSGGAGGAAAQEQVEGTSGSDYIETGDGSQGIHAYGGDDNVFAGDGDDWVNGGNGDDNLHGEEGDDVLHAGGGTDNHLYGGYGNDELFAGGGGLAYGGEDDDVIHMDSGVVIAGGGGGADVFHWSGNPGGMDSIIDFEAGVDHLDFATGFFDTEPGETLNDVLIALEDGSDTFLSAHTQYGWQMLVRLYDTDAADIQARIDNGTLLTPTSTAFDAPGGLVPAPDDPDWQLGEVDALVF